jgi:hypothetical protein
MGRGPEVIVEGEYPGTGISESKDRLRSEGYGGCLTSGGA